MSGRPWRNVKPCGTDAAHRRHLRHGEDPCQACLDAHAAKNRKGPDPLVRKPCGTPPAYRRHLYHGETPCAPCRAANTAEQAKYRARRRAIG